MLMYAKDFILAFKNATMKWWPTNGGDVLTSSHKIKRMKS